MSAKLHQEKRLANGRYNDLFSISEGNLLVLSLVPEMMLNDRYRKHLRELAIEFYAEKKARSIFKPYRPSRVKR